jgi:Holliday junction resolvase
MTAPSKRKGNEFERKIVSEARRQGLIAERAYASNGRSLGENDSVDVVVQGLRIQAKRRERLPKYLQIPEGADAVIFRQDRGDTLILLRWDDVMDKLQEGW